MQYLSFYVIQTTDDEEGGSAKKFKHFQTLDEYDYEDSEIKKFIESEFKRILKRKAERNPSTESAPTKVGRFIVEPGYELDSNPNYNLIQRLREADNKEQYLGAADELIRTYMDTAAVRGGALIMARAKLNTYFDEPFLFLLKCDFEPNIARIADERSLISRVEMAISAKNIKSILYPHMPEEGVLEHAELKIHQASHARYFEDFLKFVSYEKPLPEVFSEQVMEMVQDYMEQKWQGDEGAERREEENAIEVWASSEKRELHEHWTHEQVANASAVLVEQKPDLGFSFKLDSVSVRGLLADFGSRIHMAKHNGRYVVVIEGDNFLFEKGKSPIELLQPPDLTDIMEHIGRGRPDDEPREYTSAQQAAAAAEAKDDDVPW